MAKSGLLLSVMIISFSFACAQLSLNHYIPYEALAKSDTFQVKVNGEEVFVAYEACFGDSTLHTSQFFVEGPAEIEIICTSPIESHAIRPYHKSIAGTVDENTLQFSVSQPEMLMIEINDYQPLCLFQTPPETDVPNPDNSNVLYFAAGTHEVGILAPKSGQTIYLEPGAWVRGRVYADGVENVTIRGRGVIDARGYTSKPEKICGLEFKNSRNIRIEGIGLRTGEWWQSLFLLCDDVEVKHMNLLSFGVNNDGIDIDGVTNFRVSHCFIGCGVDGFGWHAVDAEANGEPPTRNCLAENCVIYNGHAGNGLRIGASMETQLFENITFRNITVLAHANAGIRSDHSDWATVKNLRFENFYIEQPGRPIEIRIEKTRYSNSTGFRDERGHIEGLHFNRVIASGGEIILEGFDQD
ncbi:MAG: glycosyl hydrolase family 28 protein, partial [Bacteroidota bacterium]